MQTNTKKNRTERVWQAMQKAEPLLTFLAIQAVKENGTPEPEALRPVLRIVNAGRRHVRRIAPFN
jgi:hypothetical protein